MYNLTKLRQEEFPITENHLYFNNAGIAPTPRRSQRKVAWSLEHLTQHPGHFFHEHGMPTFAAVTAELAALINAAVPEEIAAVSSTSTGINLVAQAIRWQAGDNVAFCEIEFPSNAYPWMSLERDGVEIRQVTAVDGGLTLPALEAVVDDSTRLVAASAVQFFSGHRTDLAAVGRFCQERGILFAVDAIQAIGHIPIDVQEMHIDILASGGQKSLLATPGIGFLYVRREVAEGMEPRIIGCNATVNFLHWLDYDLTPAAAAQRFLMGTPNVTGIFGMLESVRLLRELGVAHIERHTSSLAKTAVSAMAELGYEVITPAGAAGPITTFKTGLSDEKSESLIAYLDEHHITVAKHLDAVGNPHVRLSFHCYNSAAEVAQFVSVLRDWEG